MYLFICLFVYQTCCSSHFGDLLITILLHHFCKAVTCNIISGKQDAVLDRLLCHFCSSYLTTQQRSCSMYFNCNAKFTFCITIKIYAIRPLFSVWISVCICLLCLLYAEIDTEKTYQNLSVFLFTSAIVYSSIICLYYLFIH